MTGDIPKWQKDLADVVFLGADVMAYMNMRRFLQSIEANEDMRATAIFNALDTLANLTRALENKA